MARGYLVGNWRVLWWGLSGFDSPARAVLVNGADTPTAVGEQRGAVMSMQSGEMVSGGAVESGRVAIRCRYYGPTNHRGSRIRVTRFDSPMAGRDGNSMTLSWDHSLGLTENYVVAVREYVRRAGWAGTWAVSTCEGGAVAVMIPGSDRTVAR